MVADTAFSFSLCPSRRAYSSDFVPFDTRRARIPWHAHFSYPLLGFAAEKSFLGKAHCLFAAEGMEGEEGKPSGTGFSQAPGSRKAPGRGVGFLVRTGGASAAALSAVCVVLSVADAAAAVVTLL